MSEHAINISDKVIIPPSSVERFFLPWQPELLPLHEEGVSMAGASVVPPPYEVCRMRPKFHLVIFTYAGGADFLHERAWHKTRAGEVLVIPAENVQAYRAKAPWDMIWFHIHPRPGWHMVKNMRPTNRKWREGKSIREAMDALWREMTVRAPGDDRNIASTYASLLILLLKRELTSESVRQKITRPSIHAMLQQVEARLADRWSVERMAREAHVSPSQLQRLMIADLGLRPMEWVTRARMERVRQLLQHTDYKLEHIASMTGYANPFALSRAFKRLTGKSPATYRKERQKQG